MGQTHQKYRALYFMKYLSEICLKICHTSFNTRMAIWSIILFIVVFPLMHPWYVVERYEKLDRVFKFPKVYQILKQFIKHRHNISEEWGSGSFKSVRLFVYGRQGNTIDILVRDEWKRGRGLKSRALCTVLKKFKFSKFNLEFFFPSKVKLFLKVYRMESTVS